MKEIIEAKILGLAYGGNFIGEVTTEGAHQRKKIFVPWTATSERVRASVLNDKGNFLEGDLLEVLEPTLDRTKPPCPVFQRCGGCDIQHITLAAQRKAKVEMVEGMLKRQGKLEFLKGVSLTGTTLPGFNYRRRITLHVSSTGSIGFFRPFSGDVVSISSCPIAKEPLNELLTRLVPFGPELAGAIGGIVLETHDQDRYMLLKLREGRSLNDLPAPILKELTTLTPYLRVHDGRKIVYHSPREKGEPPIGHFSQVNEVGNEVLVSTVLEMTMGDHITDLYAGSGNLSFPLARKGSSVVAVELDEKLVRYGEEIAVKEQLPLKFIHKSCEKYAIQGIATPTIVLDPPRAGAKEVVTKLSPKLNKEIIYVSCNLPSLTRDLKSLVEQGYVVEEVKVIDMFPQTHHVECVARIIAR